MIEGFAGENTCKGRMYSCRVFKFCYTEVNQSLNQTCVLLYSFYRVKQMIKICLAVKSVY